MEEKKQDQMQEVKEDVKVDVETTNEEKQPKLYTQEEFDKALKEKLDEARKNGFAEGQRKASKNVNNDLSNENQELKTRLTQIENELAMQKHFQKLNELNVIEAKKGDVLDLLRGKGLEINEENITKVVEEHPEWITPKEKKGIVEMGQKEDTTKKSQDEIDNARIMNNFRKRLGLKEK